MTKGNKSIFIALAMWLVAASCGNPASSGIVSDSVSEALQNGGKTDWNSFA